MDFKLNMMIEWVLVEMLMFTKVCAQLSVVCKLIKCLPVADNTGTHNSQEYLKTWHTRLNKCKHDEMHLQVNHPGETGLFCAIHSLSHRLVIYTRNGERLTASDIISMI